MTLICSLLEMFFSVFNDEVKFGEFLFTCCLNSNEAVSTETKNSMIYIWPKFHYSVRHGSTCVWHAGLLEVEALATDPQ